MRIQHDDKSFWFTVTYNNFAPTYVMDNIYAYSPEFVNSFRSVHIILTIQQDSDIYSYTGQSFCHPNDQFNRIKGRSLALTNLLKDIPHSILSKEDRAFLCPQILYGYKKTAA